MNIPKTLKIGGHTYTVELVDTEAISGNCGQQNRARNTIKIRKDLPQTQIESTLIHEILHALNACAPEETIENWEAGLYQVFKDNNMLR